jgi:hypothetical protein
MLLGVSFFGLLIGFFLTIVLMTSVKSTFVGIVSFLAVVGFSVPATTYAWVGDQNYSNIGNIYMQGYSIPSGIGSHQGMGYGAPQQGASGIKWTTGTYPARSFDPMVDTFYYPQQSYGQGYNGGYNGGYTGGGYTGGGYSNYDYSNYGYSSYGSYPQMMYDPYFGYSAAFGPSYPTGDYDLLGTPLCQWYDYNGATPCAYDPHQWVYDQYTGSWY